MTRRVVVVTPGRPSLGERRRTETWHRLVAADGGVATTIATAAIGGRRPPLQAAADVLGVVRGRLVPEALTWSAKRVVDAVGAANPDLVILQTARSVHPELLAGSWPIVVDLVDRLSASYHQRAVLGRGPSAALFGGLAVTHARAEAHLLADVAPTVPVVLAGHGEASRSGARWIPNLVDPVIAPEPDDPPTPLPFDLVFFGTLGYRPNIEALEEFATGKPTERGLRVLVAGQRPPAVVADLCRRHGWTLVADFPSMAWLATQAAVAVAPLRSTAGIQNKVLEAALVGLPQVVSPAALDGLAPGLPCRVAENGAELVAAAAGLVADRATATALASEAQRHVVEHYTVDRWRTTIEGLIVGPQAVPV